MNRRRFFSLLAIAPFAKNVVPNVFTLVNGVTMTLKAPAGYVAAAGDVIEVIKPISLEGIPYFQSEFGGGFFGFTREVSREELRLHYPDHA